MGSTSGQEIEKLWAQVGYDTTHQFHAAFDGQRGPHGVQNANGISRLPRFKIGLEDGVFQCLGMGFGPSIHTIGVGHQQQTLVLGQRGEDFIGRIQHPKLSKPIVLTTGLGTRQTFQSCGAHTTQAIHLKQTIPGVHPALDPNHIGATFSTDLGHPSIVDGDHDVSQEAGNGVVLIE